MKKAPIAEWMAEHAEWYGQNRQPLPQVDLAEEAARMFNPRPDINAFTDPSVGQGEMDTLIRWATGAIRTAGFPIDEEM
jgi:hypothetical protein